MSKTEIQTSNAPAAIGPYSQAVMAPSGRTVYLSGQIPLDPETGALVTGDIRSQTHRVMANLQAVLSEAGLGFGDVVFTTIFLANLNDFRVLMRSIKVTLRQVRYSRPGPLLRSPVSLGMWPWRSPV